MSRRKYLTPAQRAAKQMRRHCAIAWAPKEPRRTGRREVTREQLTTERELGHKVTWSTEPDRR